MSAAPLCNDIRLAIGVIRCGDASPGEQRALFDKVSALLRELRPVELGYREIARNAFEENRRLEHMLMEGAA